MYLKTYNLFLYIGWSLFLLYSIVTGFQPDVIWLGLLNVCQLAAILEIIHAQLNWVKSPVFTTAIQVFSRVFVLVLINLLPFDAQIVFLGITGLTLISLAWGMTEIVRYGHYYFTLKKTPSSLLQSLRYTLFIGLYPLGVVGEAMIIFSYLKYHDFAINLPNVVIVGIFLGYFYFFPQMYRYMWVQRGKKLRKS